MLFKYKNAQENARGSIDCLILLGGDWAQHTQDPENEYELSKESDWPEVRPAPKELIDAYESDLIKQELAALDVSIRTLTEFALGDEEAIRIVNEAEAKKEVLRAKLK